jgi:transcriptional regulator with XRE-family HTH domain
LARVAPVKGKNVKLTFMAGQKWVDSEFSQRLGRRLKRLRTERPLTQEKLADLLDRNGIPMSWTQLARIEKGQRSLRAVEAAALADIFNVSVDQLLGGRRARPKADLTYALRAALHAKEQAHWAVESHQRTLSEAADELADADTAGRYAELVANFADACKALDVAGQVVASVGETTNPQTAAALKAARIAMMRQWLAEEEPDK